MSLLFRLANSDETVDPPINRIPRPEFIAALEEWALGKLNRQDVIDAFELDAAAETQLDTLSTWYQAAPDKQRFLKILDNALLLWNRRVIYDTEAKLIARIQEARDGINV